jgi:hypothetical protein
MRSLTWQRASEGACLCAANRHQMLCITKSCVQAHPQHKRQDLGITEAMLSKVDDSDTALVFWQLEVDAEGRAKLLREMSLRVLCGKAAALGCERLWSYARITLTDNRRSMRSQRLMELMQVKMNSHMLDDKEMTSVQLELMHLMLDGNGVAELFEELERFEEEVLMSQRAREGAEPEGAGGGADGSDNDDDVSAELDEEADILDLFDE